MRPWIAPVLFAAACFSLDLRAGDEAKPRPKLPEAVQSLVDLSRATAPEIYANTIVRLVESGKVPQRELQVEFLEDAFHAAALATDPVRLIAIPGTPSDTREIYRSRAGELGLDTISLQSRILRDLLTVDRAKARALFDQIARPVLDPRACEDPLVADIAPYYESAAAIAQSTFTAEEKDHDRHVQFLAGVLAGAKSPGELAAFANALETVTFTPGQWEVLLAMLERKLETQGADYRSFAVSFNTMQGAISRLADFGRANRVGVDGLVGSFRKYLVAQFTAPRCKPDIPVAIGEMYWFRAALSDEEIKPSERRGTVNTQAYFDSGDSKAIGEKLKSISHEFPSEDLPDFLRAFAFWSPSGSDVDVLHQKATILAALMQMRLTITDRDRIARLWVELLASSGAQRQNPAEWMWQVKSLADGIGPSASDWFRRSGNPGLMVYFPSSGTSK